MNNSNILELKIRAYEAFIRRAIEVDFPFMLKGSYVTRQYFLNPKDRIPADLDWVCMNKIDEVKTAKNLFNKWATKITELDVKDGVMFNSFKKNPFWRLIDYAMADDFPTVSTDLICWVNGIKVDFSLEISFNINIDKDPIPLFYEPLEGECFILPYSVPLSLQVSWKIHQTLVRPRFKDLFDLIALVQHVDFNKNALEIALKALLKECAVSNVNLNKLKHFLNYDFGKLFPKNSIEDNWNFWRHKHKVQNSSIIQYWGYAESITDATRLPIELQDFIEKLKYALSSSGLDIDLISHLEIPDEIEILDELESKDIDEPFNEMQQSFVRTNILNENILTPEVEKISLRERLKHFFRFWLG